MSGVKQTHCKRGHRLSGENLYVRGTGQRQCRKCRKDRRSCHTIGNYHIGPYIQDGRMIVKLDYSRVKLFTVNGKKVVDYIEIRHDRDGEKNRLRPVSVPVLGKDGELVGHYTSLVEMTDLAPLTDSET